MNNDIKTVLESCRIIDGYIAVTEDHINYIYELGYLQGKIDDGVEFLKELRAAQKE